MRVLFLPAYFQPESAASSYLSESRYEAFSKNGIQMEVYCPIPTRGVSSVIREEYKQKKEEVLYDNMLHVKRFNLFNEGKKPIFRAFRYILASFIQFYFGAFSKISKECDVLFVSSTPPIQGAMAALIKKFHKIPVVYNLQDIFPDSLVGTGLAKKNSILWKVGRAIENFTYRNVDKIIVISEDFKNNIMRKGVPEDKIVVIYNWVDEQAVINVPRSKNILFDRYGLDRSKFYVTYNGNIGLTQNMDLLLDVAKELELNDDIQFVLVGNGAYLDDVKRQIREKEIKNVTLLPFQPYEEISYVFSLGDVGLIISKPGVGANSVPSKTWSIMSASRPVLANFDENEIKTIIEDNRCGIFTKAGDKAAFIKAILDLYSNRNLCSEYGKNGRKFVVNKLSKQIGTQKSVDVIKKYNSIK